MTRKRYNKLKAKANRRFAEAVGSALFATKVKLQFLCWEIEKLPSSEQQTRLSIMASDLVRRIDEAKTPNGGLNRRDGSAADGRPS